jgi:hypothetical protein
MGEAFIVRKGGGVGFEYVETTTTETVTTQVPNESTMPFRRRSDVNTTTGRGQSDGSFIYARYGTCSHTFAKVFDSNFALSLTQSYGNEIRQVIIDNDFVYVGGLSNTVNKYHKSNLALVATSPTYGNWIFNLSQDNDFVYAGGLSNNIRKYHKGNLATAATSSNMSNIIEATAVYDGKLYAQSRNGSDGVRVWHTSNLALIGSTTAFLGWGSEILVDDNFIISLARHPEINKYHVSNLSFIQNVNVSVNTAQLGSKQDSEFIYVGRETANPVLKLRKSNFQTVATTNSFGTGPVVWHLRGNFSYISGDDRSHLYENRGVDNVTTNVTTTDPEGSVVINGVTYIKEEV